MVVLGGGARTSLQVALHADMLSRWPAACAGQIIEYLYFGALVLCIKPR